MSSNGADKDNKSKRASRWYFGGLASAGAACATHPLDLLKVAQQTQQEKLSIVRLTVQIVRNQGIRALYNGISASLLRQLTYSTTRFGIYEVGRGKLSPDTGFFGKILLAGFAGAAGGLIGTPADMVNVRMQNDVKLPVENRRNYKNAFHGLYSVYKGEGASKLMNGASAASTRGFFMTIGQIAFYDQIKTLLLQSGYFEDNPQLHFVSSLAAGAIATLLTQPLDVLKTRAMNAEPGQYKNLFDIAKHTAKVGPLGFYKGFFPAFVRLGPHTILTFLLLEQLRMNFGIDQ